MKRPAIKGCAFWLTKNQNSPTLVRVGISDISLDLATEVGFLPAPCLKSLLPRNGNGPDITPDDAMHINRAIRAARAVYDDGLADSSDPPP